MSTAQTESDDADMLEGFNSGETDQSGDKQGSSDQLPVDPPVPAGQQATDAPAAAEPSSSAEPAIDPFAALPEAVRNLLAKVPALETEIAAVHQTNRRLDGQVRSQQSQLAKLTAQPAPAPTPTRHEKLEHARTSVGHDMPEVMDALDEIAALIPKTSPQQAEAPAAQAPAQQPPADIDPVAKAHFEALDLIDPHWFETLESTDAKLWIASQPEMAAKYAQADTAKKLAEVLTGFKASRQQTQTAQSSASTRQARMAAAVLPTGGARAPARAQAGTEDDGLAEGFNS